MVNATSRTPNKTNPTRMHPITYGSRNARMNRSASVGESGPRSAPADAVEVFAAPDDVDSTTIFPARLVVVSAECRLRTDDGIATDEARRLSMTLSRLVFDVET